MTSSSADSRGRRGPGNVRRLDDAYVEVRYDGQLRSLGGVALWSSSVSGPRLM